MNMFEIFKKTEKTEEPKKIVSHYSSNEEVSREEETVVSIEEQKITVKDIHTSFLTAMEEVLKNENIILEEEKNKNEDLLALANLGFDRIPKIQKERENDEKRKIDLVNIEWAKYYSHHYPQNKFITDEMLSKVCKKYNLVIGTPRDYIGEIPDRCVKEIAKFKLRNEDNCIFTHWRSSSWGSDTAYVNYLLGKNEKPLNVLDIYMEKTDETVNRLLNGEIIRSHEMYSGSGFINIIVNKMLNSVGIHEHSDVGTSKNFLKVVAPSTMMNMTGKKVNEKNELVSNMPPDPVVLCRVPGGNLIISLWGDESEIDELQNPNLN